MRVHKKSFYGFLCAFAQQCVGNSDFTHLEVCSWCFLFERHTCLIEKQVVPNIFLDIKIMHLLTGSACCGMYPN